MFEQIDAKPTISFLGAAGTVTGSRFLLECAGTRVLIDAGMFQGKKELRLKNWEPFEVEPESLNAVILTHAHLDHCGYLPKLVKEGFRNKIHSSLYTAKLAEVILRDSARIQTEDAAYAAKKGFSKHNPPKALYDEMDAIKTISAFETHQFHERVQVATETFVTFHPAGHILGAAFLVVEFFGKRILFTGDLGRQQHPLLKGPADIPAGHFDAMITESTYGDRIHESPSNAFAEIINQTIDRGGSVLIPAFAVDRTEVILVQLRELWESGQIRQVPVYADSPMALKALAFYRAAIDEASAEIRDDIATNWKGKDPFDAGNLVELLSVEESKSINDPASPCIIISASGMGTGGRVVHHLRSMLPKPQHSVILVGYQAIGTRGRNLLEGASEVKMHGEFVAVNAEIHSVQSFSVHADADELIDWLKTATEAPKSVIVVHGELEAAETFAQRLSQQLGFKAIAPRDTRAFEL